MLRLSFPHEDEPFSISHLSGLRSKNYFTLLGIALIVLGFIFGGIDCLDAPPSINIDLSFNLASLLLNEETKGHSEEQLICSWSPLMIQTGKCPDTVFHPAC